MAASSEGALLPGPPGGHHVVKSDASVQQQQVVRNFSRTTETMKKAGACSRTSTEDGGVGNHMAASLKNPFAAVVRIKIRLDAVSTLTESGGGMRPRSLRGRASRV